MDQDLKLFKLLSDGKFHSGQVIAKSFGVSRSRVWALVNSLEEKGVVISRVRGKGYRYNEGSSLLDVPFIQKALPDLIAYYSPIMTSTSDVAREYSSKQQQSLLVTTEYQTGGRGRRGRLWASCYAHNLMFTYAIPEFNARKGLEGLSLVVGLSLAKVLNAEYDLGVQVKWPNDLLVNNEKLAGILVEVQGDISSSFNLLVGVGINVNELPVVADRQVISLRRLLGSSVSRSDLLVKLMRALEKDIQIFRESGFSDFKNEWNELDAYRSKQVYIDQAGNKTYGVSCGVTDAGALLLDLGDKCEEIFGGEVSLRAVDE